jgi:O-methyltransferase involved in polyketide biosynthesis
LRVTSLDCDHIPPASLVSLAACALAGDSAPEGPDLAAERLWRKIGADAARLSVVEMRAARDRARFLDAATRAWARSHPSGTVVELGAGLSTRCARLADLSLTYVAVDEPPLADLRRDLFPTPHPFVQVGMPLQDRRWSRAIVAVSREILVLVPDLLVDARPQEALRVLTSLSAELPGRTPIVAAYGPRMLFRVASPSSRRASLEVRIDHGFGATESIRLPCLRWDTPPALDDGLDRPALASLRLA